MAAIHPNRRFNVLEFELVGLKTSPASKNTTALSFLVRFTPQGTRTEEFETVCHRQVLVFHSRDLLKRRIISVVDYSV